MTGRYPTNLEPVTLTLILTFSTHDRQDKDEGEPSLSLPATPLCPLHSGPNPEQ